MRRIYESDALQRDEGGFTPSERRHTDPQAMRSVDGTALSRLLVPDWLRHRAISITVATPRTEYARGEAVPFRVTMRNTMPFPITLRTRSPRVWTWSVDGARDATRVSVRDPPAESGEFRFARGERKRFEKRWEQAFRVSKTEWERADPGEVTIGAGLNVEHATAKGLYDEVTVRLTE
ncbi:hypothetical protein [Halalkalicoccus jeotgali]|uniref:DUF7974 domain-containing protein n=1 Tax=Halalkalicoccus jeotgali (strain DSM 18796 / CECT 7217 / JCM 14584 / KCTC 4019 / B3) TaxID=795797 RepID=D8J669_HALJB|nr:hypothetical protein [Halalkalicoccus jeotgali]ADJ15787.1 hypothetical protein HacjB3_12020 [Halalkalicoccus jeotgali B3]ELY37189.1 hypothetical protein C497_10608 [Halalkalicoccus jeotgali B3]